MTDTVDTSRDSVAFLAAVMNDRAPQNSTHDQRRAARVIMALLAERDQLRREVEEARSVRGAAQVLYGAWCAGEFENDADAALQDLLDGGQEFCSHDALENWFSAIIKARP